MTINERVPVEGLQNATVQVSGTMPCSHTCKSGQAPHREIAGTDHSSIERPTTKSNLLRVLVVEDEANDIELVLRSLRKDGFELTSDVALNAHEFTSLIQTNKYDIILADYNLPQWRGTDALDILCQENCDVPLIVVTGCLSEEKAMLCIRQGAVDCVLKHHIARLPTSVRRALEERRLREQRRRFQTELASKVAELARSNAELEQFAYVASHDLQEPLRMIANYTQLISERYSGQLDEQADKYIRYAVDGAVRMQALIQDLLRLSRAGKGQNEPVITQCNKVMEQAVKNLQAAVEESNTTVHWTELPMVMADPMQLTQVFQNLLANGIKFRGPTSPVIHVNAERRDREWVFSVSDNGIGIPADRREDVFIVFRRLHTRAEYPGNGIGLSICKKIIERHGGKMWIEDQGKPGCCFKFTLSAELPPNSSVEARE